MSFKLNNVVRLRARGNLRDNINAVVISISVAQLGGEGWEAFPALFWKKKCSILEKKALIVSIFILNLPFKILRVSKRKNFKVFPTGPFFWNFWRNVYQSALISRNLPCPEKCLVVRLLNWRREKAKQFDEIFLVVDVIIK